MSLQTFFFDDFKPGQVYETARRTISEADFVNFTTSYGFFEPIFMDRDFVTTHTPYKKPVVPGALTFSMAEGLAILTGILHSGMAFLGVQLDILKPVFIGDTVSVHIEVVETRRTKKPGRGIVTFRHRVINQDGEEVVIYTVKRMMRQRSNSD